MDVERENHGLPQNRDASSFLSNVLLSRVDKAMAGKGYDYYRYVDDIRVIADDEVHLPDGPFRTSSAFSGRWG